LCGEKNNADIETYSHESGRHGRMNPSIKPNRGKLVNNRVPRLRVFCVFLVVLSTLVIHCISEETISLKHYYEYDRNLPLSTDKRLVAETSEFSRWHLQFQSLNGHSVPALLTMPKQGSGFIPAVLYLHGLGDHKNADYMRYGDSVFVARRFAVLRIDFPFHGERDLGPLKRKELMNYPYMIRNAAVQAVFDLRRAVDLLDEIPELDQKRTGFLGISLGGIVGTVFVGVENRIEFPVIALAGGGLKFMTGTKALQSETREMFAPIEPLNFVKLISPRPTLFVNASRDEVIPKVNTELLYYQAKKPKEIKWYDSKHVLPAHIVLPDIADYFQEQFATK